MTQGPSFELWFENQSLAGGQALVYQPASNVTLTSPAPQQLAWMVVGANPSVSVRFTWSLDYGFLWIDETPARTSQQIVAADPQSANRVALSHNQNGFFFGTPTASSPTGSLMIAEDATIPAASEAVAGISMSGAGTFAVPVRPNTNLTFTPAATSSLSYRISFGSYNLEVGDLLVPATLNPAGTVVFPQGVTAMTAILSPTNTWTIASGAPRRRASSLIEYQAGVGVVASAPAPEKTVREESDSPSSRR